MSGALFVTRKFPPAVGGMETLAADVWATLRAGTSAPTRLIAHGGSVIALPWFMLRALVGTIRSVRLDGMDLVLTGDVVMYLLLRPVLRMLKVRHATMAMGKDIVWENGLYQRALRAALPEAPLVLAISAATAEAARVSGVAADRVQVIRLGVEPPAADPTWAVARAALAERHELPDGAVVLLSLGRLVRRKGVEWFIRSVLPGLPDNVVYLVAGTGEEADSIAQAVNDEGQGDRVVLLGSVSAADREMLMRGADLFVQANIEVPGDMEGFGLVAVEAAMRGACVVAADREGLRDAVRDGETGVLVPSGDASAWQAVLNQLVAAPEELRERGERFAVACRSWYGREAMGRELCSALGLPGGPA